MAAYGDVAVNDQSRLHQGDVYNIHHHQEKLVESENGRRLRLEREEKLARYDSLYNSLTFDRREERQRVIATALSTTCEWLFNHHAFLSWIDDTKQNEHHGFLWLKGKPGSGKSTIIKELLERASAFFPTQMILSYFFNARAANVLEKSPLGLYRSLLYQLLSSLSSIRDLFSVRFASKVRGPETGVETWSEVELQNFFIELARAHLLPPMLIIVDALDEGDDDHIRQMVEFFEDLADYTTASKLTFRICFSSRHYPHINIERGLSLVMEDEIGHTADIIAYVQRKLSGRRNQRLQEIQNEIVRRSAGVFLWVVLVVKRLNLVYAQGKSLKVMEKELETVPATLQELFANVLKRDEEGMDQCIILLRWVLFTFEPLTLQELYLAVWSSLDPCEEVFVGGGDDEDDEDDEYILDTEQLARFLLTTSRGLVELPHDRTQVQFIHETVREFLLDVDVSLVGPTPQHNDSVQSSGLLFDAGLCHMSIATACMRWLTISFRKALVVGKLNAADTFLRYAVCHWRKHLDESGLPCSQEFLKYAREIFESDHEIFRVWLKWKNSSVKADELDPKDLEPTLQYAVAFRLPELIHEMIARGEDVNARGGPLGNALQLAADLGFESMVRILLENGADVNAKGGAFHTALIAASYMGQADVVKILLENGADVHARSRYGMNALTAATNKNHLGIVEIIKQNIASSGTQIMSNDLMNVEIPRSIEEADTTVEIHRSVEEADTLTEDKPQSVKEAEVLTEEVPRSIEQADALTVGVDVQPLARACHRCVVVYVADEDSLNLTLP